MHDVAVAAVNILFGLCQGNVVFRGILNGIFPAADFPLAPWCNNLELGIERHHGKLKTDLIVAFAGTAMGDGFRPLRFRDFNHFFGHQRTGNGSAQKVIAFVYSSRLHGREYVVL